MAVTQMVRHTCNFCSATQDTPSVGDYPKGWSQFHVSDNAPVTSHAVQIDLCPRHVDDFKDYVSSPNGPHRVKAEERSA